MAYIAHFMTLAKKLNSTYQPDLSGADSYSCTILDGSSFLSPTIKLDSGTTIPTMYNYCYLDVYARYYWITHWSYDNGLWMCHMDVDPLASWKSYIGSQEVYISRAADAFNGRIVDTTYPVIAGVSTIINQQNANPFAESFSGGYFVVGVINGSSNSVGAVSYYVMTNSQFRAFSSYLYNNTGYLGTITDVTNAMLKVLFNPFEYVVSCTWLPFQPPVGASTAADGGVAVGWWIVPVSCYFLSGYTRSAGTVTVQVPKHPLSGVRGYYLNTEPYSSYYLDFPPFGSIDIPAGRLVDTNLLSLNWDVDCITGIGRCLINAGISGNDTITTLYAQVGVPVQMAKAAPSIEEMTSAVVGDSAYQPWDGFKNWWNSDWTTVGQEFREELASIAQGVVGSISNFTGLGKQGSLTTQMANAYIASKSPMQTIGGNGGFMAGYYPVRLIGTFAQIANEDPDHFGRPLCEKRVIGTLHGYIQCGEVDFEIPCSGPELTSIMNHAAAGFYYE